MKIDSCLILSAGMGTRMGKIGIALPKVLWPVFETTLLDLQVALAHDLGCQKIFINSHHLHQMVKKHINKHHKSITLLHEKELLGVGGAIHNVIDNIEKAKKGNLLLLNADQFLFFDQTIFKTALQNLETNVCVLFSILVKPQNGYNEIILENNLLKDIRHNSGNIPYLTYSGSGLVNLDKIKFQSGPSAFFKTVADYNNQNVLFLNPSKYEYWDFGTTERYYNSMFKLLSELYNTKSSGRFINFCKRNNVFDMNKLCKKPIGYEYNFTGSGKIINMSQYPAMNEDKKEKTAIILDSAKETVITDNGIYFYGEHEKL